MHAMIFTTLEVPQTTKNSCNAVRVPAHKAKTFKKLNIEIGNNVGIHIYEFVRV